MGLGEPMIVSTMNATPLDGLQEYEGFTMWFNKSSMWASKYTHLEGSNGTSDSDKVIEDTFTVILDIYTPAQG
jgi:hypothetical protein